MRKPPLQDVIVRPSRARAEHRDEPVAREGSSSRARRAEFVAREEAHDLPPHQPRPAHREPTDEMPSYMRTEQDGRRRVSKKWLTIAVGVGAVVILFSVVLSLLFAGATVTVYPKQDTPVVNASFKAQINGEGGTLPFQRMVLERTQQHTVVALGESEVEERASGKLTIYNEYSTTPQRLIKNTRFESTEGRIYRIRESVEVPGKKNDNTPGSIEVSVFAEEPGEDYNMGPDSFTIPGFAGLPQEGHIYARSTGDMTGGFKGVKRTVSDNDRTKALEELESALRDQLLAAAFDGSDKPKGYVLFKGAVFFEFNPLPDETAETDKVVLSLSGKLHGILFPEDQLAQRLAQLTIPSYDGSPIRIENPLDLSVTIEPVDPSDSADVQAPWEVAAYNVRAQGKAHFIWQYDEMQLAKDLAGKDKKILDSPQEGGIREAYPGIDNLQASIRPFWKQTFPENPNDIAVVTELDAS